jgi:myo-inositol 2-dehydrogenase/D-chiro-inositol 1-dehydrogenase
MSGELRMALIGAGSWGRLVAAEMARVPGLALAGVADSALASARCAADALGSRAYARVDEVLADDDVDAVAIAVPNDLHAELAIAALQQGKHVLIEKPMALTVEEAERMQQAALASARLLVPDHVQRFYRPLQAVKRIVAEGVLGEVQLTSVARRDHLHRTKHWLQQRRHAGGMLYQSTCHEYDLLRWLLDSEAVEITCAAAPLVIARDTLDYPDAIVSQLRFASGVAAQVWSCMSDPLMGYDGVVTGSEGSCWFDLYDARVRYRRFGEDACEERFDPSDGWAPWAWIASGAIGAGEGEAVRGLLSAFASATRSEGPPPLAADDGVRAVELAQAGYLSLVERRAVRLPLPGGDRARRTYLELLEPAA